MFKGVATSVAGAKGLGNPMTSKMDENAGQAKELVIKNKRIIYAYNNQLDALFILGVLN
jgi:hypothetical protein